MNKPQLRIVQKETEPTISLRAATEAVANLLRVHEDRSEDDSYIIARAMLNAEEVDCRLDVAFREAVLNELIVCGIYTKEHDENPRKAVEDAILWNCNVALDPAVSKEALALKKSGEGLKNHHIAGLISAVAKKIETDFKTPQSTREVIRHVALDYLSDNGLMIDSAVKRYR